MSFALNDKAMLDARFALRQLGFLFESAAVFKQTFDDEDRNTKSFNNLQNICLLHWKFSIIFLQKRSYSYFRFMRH